VDGHGRNKVVVRGGYSLLYDRVGFALANESFE
jgi:hypothetical protein